MWSVSLAIMPFCEGLWSKLASEELRLDDLHQDVPGQDVGLLYPRRFTGRDANAMFGRGDEFPPGFSGERNCSEADTPSGFHRTQNIKRIPTCADTDHHVPGA